MGNFRFYGEGCIFQQTGERERDGQNAQHCDEEFFTEKKKSKKTLADFRKKLKRHLLTSIRKSVAVHTSGSIFVDRVELARRTKLELELMKVLECSIDGSRNYESNLVPFKVKTFNQFLP